MVLAVIDQVVDREVLPSVVYEVALTVYLVGMVVSLVIGWYHGEKGEQKAPKIEIGILAVVVMVGLGLSWRVIQNDREAQLQDAINPEDLRSIAVLYLDDATAAGSLGPTVEGISEGLITALQRVNELDVTSRNGARAVRGLGLTPDSIAAVLGVGALIDGSVDQVGDQFRVSVRLLEGATGTLLFRETYDWPTSEVATIGTELAGQVASALRERLGVAIRLREGEASAPNAAAWLQVARAENYLKDAKLSATQGDVDGVIDAFDAAEGELDEAVQSAPGWPAPLILRAQVEYEQFILAQSVEELIAMMAEAVEWANRALEIDATSAAALEWRGTAEYRRWLLGAEDEATLETLFNSAKADLERAHTLDQGRASVNSTLSHLYYQTEDWAQAILAAREAYEQDAFLDAADGVLWRIYTASYDMGEFDGARQWCETGYDRFPLNFRFVMCQGWLLTMTDSEPDVEKAWALHDQLVPLLVERPEFFEVQSRLIVAGVIGRAGLADSAQAVFRSATASSAIDPDRELWAIEAAMRSVMGDVPGALNALERYVLSQAGETPDRHWWWDNIRAEPAFQRLRDSN